MVNTSRSAAGRLVRIVAVAFVLLAVVSASATATAGVTTVRVDAATERMAVSETTTVHLVVDGVDGGVGAYDLAVGLSDSSVATITDVTLLGEPKLHTVEVAQDGASADLKAALMDTDDAGPVTVAAVTLSGVAPGTTDVSVSVSALGDEDGSPYPTDVSAASVTVDAVGATDSGVYDSAAEDDSVDQPDDAAVSPSDDASDGPAADDDPVTESADGADDVALDDDAETSGDAPAALDAPTEGERSVPNDEPLRLGPEDVPTWTAVIAAAALVAALVAVRRRRR
ncbi:hypothetical protein NDI76_18995 [Halogeometricum sp. S1BR25-6]|uniref:Cell surface protein n=1 Tax=Halogeometricum salsisoli TaxID=2950536 RepID=A0ABU2GJ62_9EURY|nr:hypothetical protein [Halogeometricum sp. S1BR25-6]MDS0300840.1 hypothetical protein [Halogeometricum sp. S1BR25-6]